jgi:hypothetical protein
VISLANLKKIAMAETNCASEICGCLNPKFLKPGPSQVELRAHVLLSVLASQLQDCRDQFVWFDGLGKVCLETGPPGPGPIFVTSCSRKSDRRHLSEFRFKSLDILQQFVPVHFGHR